VSGGEAIGTTGRGIGPCYRDKVGRALAIRLGDLYRADLRDKIVHIAGLKSRLLTAWQGSGAAPAPLDPVAIHAHYVQYAERLRPFVCDTTAFLLDAVEAGKPVLFEGAQGALLDIDHGTFPYVTSSNSSGLGVASGSGVPGRWVDRVIGVVKAYSTRVGGGPLPTEQDNAIGQRIRDRGNEYGTVTRRPRRCGWFDAVAARYTARLSGVDEIAVMLLDVLAGFDDLEICSAYEIDGVRTTQFPGQIDDLRKAVPVYETLPGWTEELTDVRSYAALPAAARTTISSLKPHRSSKLPPPRATIITSGRGMGPPWGSALKPAMAAATSPAQDCPCTATGQISTWRGKRSRKRCKISRITAPEGEVTTPITCGKYGIGRLRAASNSPSVASIALRFSSIAISAPAPAGAMSSTIN
jgi:adenylosuccinate synthase